MIVATTAAQTSQSVSATHSQVTGESSQAVPSTLALVLPIAPPQTGTDDTIPYLVASSEPQQQQYVPVSEPPPLVTIEVLIIVIVTVSVAPTIVAALVQSLPATESMGQLEGETAQSSDSSDVDYT